MLTSSNSKPFLLKQSIETRKKLKELQIIKMQSISIFLDMAKFVDFWWKTADASRTQGVCHVIYIFLDLVSITYKCAKSYHCRICVTNFMEERPFCLPIPRNCEQKLSIWTTHHTFLESRHPELTKNPHYILSPEEKSINSWTIGVDEWNHVEYNAKH